ncbi:MAG: hypothetical protein ABJP48_11660 [Erythrobacter sp.]
MNGAAKYDVPTGVLGLSGPVARPLPGTLPLRGDLAHIALAGVHLAAHYVIPHIFVVKNPGAQLLQQPDGGSEMVCDLEAGAELEVLDHSGDWAWGCLGPDGPSGYLKADCLSPQAG